jgi:hypothetical protein
MAIKATAEAPLKGSESAGANIDKQIQQKFTRILSGEESRYSPKVMTQMKQGLFRESRGQAKASEDKAMTQAARFGVARGGVLQKRFQEIDTSSRAQYTQGVTQLMIEKANKEFDDKMGALNMAQQWLNSKRQYDIGLRQIAATIQSAEIQAGATLGAARLSADATKKAAGMSAGAARHAANLAHERWKGEFAHQVAMDKLAASRQAAIDAGLGR